MRFLPLLVSLAPQLMQLLPGEREAARAMARRMAMRAVLGTVMVLLLLVAAGFALAAAYMALAERYGPPAGAAVVAGGLVLLALLCAVGMMLGERPATRPPGAATWDATRAAALAPLDELKRTVESKPVQSVLIAAAAGALVTLLRRR
ncbi:MAG: hypothetical protein U1E14_01495 [Geminicoccaceae bacterium]